MHADTHSDSLGLAGTVIAEKYRLEKVVGEGGFSVVYRAEHLIWRQPVAIKCFKALQNAPEDQRSMLLDGFVQEGKLMAELSSRSAAIVQARDIGTFTTPDGTWMPYMVLEWLEGRPLDVLLDDEIAAGAPLRSLPEAMTLLEPAATALDLAHSKGIAHRDIKPQNIFLVGDPRRGPAFVKVLDFGIAKVMADHANRATALAHTGKDITSFTPSYGAPEQFSRTHGATGPWTDVFALALVLIEVLIGRPVLAGDDYMQLAIASRDPQRRPTPRAFGLPITDAAEAVFARALAVSPAERFPTMGAFWAALHAAVFPGATWTPGASAALAAQPGAALSQPMPGSPGAAASAPYPASLPLSQLMAAPGQPIVVTSPSAHTSVPIAQAATAVAPSTASPPVQPAPSRANVAVAGVALVVVLAMVGGVAAFFAKGGKDAPTAPTATADTTPKASAAPPVSAAARRTECPKGMVLVPGGKFFMGSDDPAFKLWQPAHKVTLDTFCIDAREVTADDYKACSDQGECKRPDALPDYPKAESTSEADHDKARAAYAELCNFGKAGRGSHPINCVSWALADAYCKVQKKRLPTEAEWEFSARGSDGRKYPWGDDPGAETHMNACGKECNAWEKAHGLKLSATMYPADDGFEGTAPVGSFPKGRTKFGADDMVGNVWEWTSDWFETYKPDESVNPLGAPAGERKAIRGGGFNGGVALWLNPAFRYHQVATATTPAIGFRCAVSL
jgi:formylglycine-generating enzyme required for sulfatase activity